MKKLLVVLMILFVGILICGCTSQPAKPVTPTVAPTTEVPTPVPTTVAPTPVPTNATVNVTKTATPTPTPTPIPTKTITFNSDMTITPDPTVIIKAGTKVIWKNNDPFKPHGIQAIDVQYGKYFGGTGPIEIPYGKTYEVTFDKPGTYDYTTVFQPVTIAKIIVQ